MTNSIMAATYIEQLARAEESIARFYEMCAKMLYDDRKFWQILQSHEMWHAKVLRDLKEQVRGQKIKLLPEHASIREIELSVEYVEQMTRIIRNNGVDLDKALETSCNIEKKTVDVKAFKAFDESSSEVRDVLAVIHEQTEKHMEIITSRMENEQQKKNSKTWVNRLLSIAGFSKKKKSG